MHNMTGVLERYDGCIVFSEEAMPWSCCQMENYIEIINGAHDERGNRTIDENDFFTDIAMIETRPVQ